MPSQRSWISAVISWSPERLRTLRRTRPLWVQEAQGDLEENPGSWAPGPSAGLPGPQPERTGPSLSQVEVALGPEIFKPVRASKGRPGKAGPWSSPSHAYPIRRHSGRSPQRQRMLQFHPLPTRCLPRIAGGCQFPVPQTRFPPLLWEVWRSVGKAVSFFFLPPPRPAL